jgi:nucleoside-diphosphate-sugar epimerase
LAVESEFLRYADERGLPVVVVQPAIVYGPFIESWTMWPVQQLRCGQVVLPDDGGGLCNAVYVDGVVDALVLAAQKDEAVGERLLISGDSPVTWRQFYAAYERALGIQSVVLMATEEIHRIARSNLRSLRRDPLCKAKAIGE